MRCKGVVQGVRPLSLSLVPPVSDIFPEWSTDTLSSVFPIQNSSPPPDSSLLVMFLHLYWGHWTSTQSPRMIDRAKSLPHVYIYFSMSCHFYICYISSFPLLFPSHMFRPSVPFINIIATSLLEYLCSISTARSLSYILLPADIC